MAVKDGLPSTDFSRMNREYIKAVAEGGSGGGGGELDSAFFYVKLEENPDYDDPSWYKRTVATVKELIDAMDAGKILIGNPGEFVNCGDAGNDKYYLSTISVMPNTPSSELLVYASHFEQVNAADIATAHFILNDNSLVQGFKIAMTPIE